MTDLAPLRRSGAAGDPVRVLVRAGAEPSMVEDFRALAEATAPGGLPRYREQPTLEALARFLVRGSSGVNRDAALFELCHLVNAVDACGTAADRRNAFFLGPEQASAQRFRARFAEAQRRGGWRRPGFTQTTDGIAIQYPDGPFTVHFGRIPFLAALYEFLASLEGFAFYADFQAIFDEMRGTDVKAIQAASNRIASHLRQYRRRTLAISQQDGKFDLILAFLMGRSPQGRLVIDDQAVMDFWSEKSHAGDFRAYRTVFDGFAYFIRALDGIHRAESLAAALPIGADGDRGEVEPDDATDNTVPGEWVSPLDLLDQAPAAAIKFFKKESERKPIEALMTYGPLALRLPLAFLRLETFSPVQSAITTDLQVGRGTSRVAARISCAEAVPYDQTVAALGQILDLIARLQKAAFYVLHNEAKQRQARGETVVPMRVLQDDDSDLAPEVIERLAEEAARTFRAIARKGFDEAGLSEDGRVEGFRIGASALVAAATQLGRYLAAARQIDRNGCGLKDRFAADREAFGRKFALLYGVLP